MCKISGNIEKKTHLIRLFLFYPVLITKNREEIILKYLYLGLENRGVNSLGRLCVNMYICDERLSLISVPKSKVMTESMNFRMSLVLIFFFAYKQLDISPRC